MQLYLVQHGKAASKEEDPDRPLTDEGRAEIDAVMLLLTRFAALTAERIVHSGKLRAAQTAEAFATRLGVPAGEQDGLKPMDDPGVWAERLVDDGKDTMLVGHKPHLPKLASLLLAGDPDAGVVDFANGGVVCLREEDGNWSLQWSVPPSLVS